MARTRQDLIELVLQNLGVLAAGQSAAAEDRETVDRRIDPKLVELARREVIVGLSADALDDGVFLYVADIIAYACRVPFGITGAKAELLTAAATAAEAMLKVMARQYSATAATDEFDVVRDVLEKLGVVAAGQDPSIQDRGVVSARVEPMLADLRARNVTTITSLGQAESAQLRHFANILAGICAGSFGVEPAVGERLGNVASGAEGALLAMQRQFDQGVGTSGTFDLIQATLENLGAVTVGRTASAKDRAIVNARIGPMLADLRNREVVDLASVTGADTGTLLHLSTILTAACALAFGVPAATWPALQTAAGQAEAALNRQTRQLDRGTGTAGGFDLAQAVLERLAVVAPGQSGTAKDRAMVTARVTPVLDSLRLREVIALPSLETAPAGTLVHLASLVALAVAPGFPVSPEALALLTAEAGRAETELSLIARQLDGGVATSGTFDVIQATLESLGVVIAGYSGSAKDRAVVSARVVPTLADLRLREVLDIPSIEAADPATLVHLAAVLTAACAPAFGKDALARKVFDADRGRAEAALKALARQLDAGTATSTVFDPVQVALELIGIVSAGQSASEKDRAVVYARVQPLLLELRGRDICGVTDLSELTTDLQRSFARLLAADCALSFAEVAPARLVMLQGMVAGAEQVLRYQSFVYDARPPLRVEPFWGRRCGGWRG